MKKAYNANRSYNARVERDKIEAFPKDNGCSVSPSCLDCPLPRCKYDNPGEHRAAQRATKDAKVVEAIAIEKLTKDEAAERFKCTSRTIFRIMRRSRVNA